MLQIFITQKCYKYFDPIYEENKLDREIDTCLPRKKVLCINTSKKMKYTRTLKTKLLQYL